MKSYPRYSVYRPGANRHKKFTLHTTIDLYRFFWKWENFRLFTSGTILIPFTLQLKQREKLSVNKMFHFQDRSRAAVPCHRNCAEIGVLCVNCGPILLLCRHGYERKRKIAKGKNRIICIMRKCLNPWLNDRSIWTQHCAILLRENVANGFEWMIKSLTSVKHDFRSTFPDCIARLSHPSITRSGTAIHYAGMSLWNQMLVNGTLKPEATHTTKEPLVYC